MMRVTCFGAVLLGLALCTGCERGAESLQAQESSATPSTDVASPDVAATAPVEEEDPFAEIDSGWETDRPEYLQVLTPPSTRVEEFRAGEKVELLYCVDIESWDSDPTGQLDEITVSWKQKLGPTVEIRDAQSGEASFVAPVVTAPTEMTFIFEVSNASGSRSTEVELLVNP
jgi:hypothetical protein